MKYLDFINKNKSRLIIVNPKDDMETGPYRLLETEINKAISFEKKGYQIFTIGLDPEDEQSELVTEGISDNPFVQGYLILIK